MNGTAFESAYSLETGDLGSYIWSNTPGTDARQIMTFESVNGDVIGYSPEANQFSVLLVTDED
ncbi:hypothetical protein D046_4155 [Vibrio parahaemolyticus V-223/04]|nr:hypothetical protein D046_4155 [Vibrio parahaemolyticus V-223/04]